MKILISTGCLENFLTIDQQPWTKLSRTKRIKIINEVIKLIDTSQLGDVLRNLIAHHSGADIIDCFPCSNCDEWNEYYDLNLKGVAASKILSSEREK